MFCSPDNFVTQFVHNKSSVIGPQITFLQFLRPSATKFVLSLSSCRNPQTAPDPPYPDLTLSRDGMWGRLAFTVTKRTCPSSAEVTWNPGVGYYLAMLSETKPTPSPHYHHLEESSQCLAMWSLAASTAQQKAKIVRCASQPCFCTTEIHRLNLSFADLLLFGFFWRLSDSVVCLCKVFLFFPSPPPPIFKLLHEWTTSAKVVAFCWRGDVWCGFHCLHRWRDWWTCILLECWGPCSEIVSSTKKSTSLVTSIEIWSKNSKCRETCRVFSCRTNEAMSGGVTYQESLRKRLGVMRPSRQDLQQFIAQHPPSLTEGIV